MSAISLLAAAAAAAVTNVPTSAVSIETSVAELPVVVVEASRIDATRMEMPSGVRVIGREEIAASGSRDVVDLLAKKAPELHVRRMGAANPALTEIAMRGYGENGFGRTLVLVDGERLNSPDLNTPNLARIALGSVAKIEVLGGPQCVLQGDNASAGVINVITEPQDYARRSFAEVHGGSWGSVGGAVGTRGGIEEEGLKYWADGAWDRSDGYRSHSGYDIWNLNAGLKKSWETGTYLRFSGFFNDSRYDLPGYLSYDEWKADPRDSHATEDNYGRSTYGFNTTFNAQLNDENALKVTGNFSDRKMDGHQRYAGGSYYDMEYDIYSYRLLTEWINTTELRGFENEFLLGVQYGYDTMRTDTDTGTHSSCARNRQTMDVFAQDTFRILDELALQLGGRYSRAWSYSEEARPPKKQDHLGACDVALVWNPVEDAKVYAKWSRLYRNPFLDEVPYDPRTWAPMGLLDPEQGWNVEVGADWQATDELSFGADAYYTGLEDEIFYDAVGGRNVNSPDETARRGVDVRATWEKDKLAALSVAASYVKATFDGGAFGRNLIPLVPEVTVSANGRVWLRNDCSVFGGYRFQGDMYSASDFNNDYARVDWFGVFHIGAIYEPAFAEWVRGIKVSVTVDNLLDERYCDYATYGTAYWPGAGRSFMIALRYEF